MSLADADAVLPDDQRVEDWIDVPFLKEVVFQPLQDDLVLVDATGNGGGTAVRFARYGGEEVDGTVGIAYVQPDPDMNRVFVVDPGDLLGYAQRLLEDDGSDADWSVKTVDDDGREWVATGLDERHLPGG